MYRVHTRFLRVAVCFAITAFTVAFFWQLAFSFADFWVDATPANSGLDLLLSRGKGLDPGSAQQPQPYSTDSRVLEPFFTKTVLLNWLPILIVALLSIWLRNWPFTSNCQENDEVDQPESCQTFWKQQVSAFFSYQLQPHSFWIWALEGGFSIRDLCVVLLWLGLQVCVLCFSASYYWRSFEEEYRETGKWHYGSRAATRYGVAGLAGAWAAMQNLMLLFLPVPRNSFLQYLFGTSFPVLIRYHRWLGHATLLSLLLHGLPFYAQWIYQERFWGTLGSWQGHAINSLAASLSLLFCILLWATAFPIIRRRFFNVFYWSHIIGSIGFITFMLIHFNGCIWFVPGLVLFFLDATFRLSQWGVMSDIQGTYLAADKSFVTLQATFNKVANVKPAQFLFLNVPSVSRFAWHPVSVAAVRPGADGLTDVVSLHLKARGRWTKGVIAQMWEHGHVKVRADGPYGSALEQPNWANFSTLVLIAGGMGITPVLGILNSIATAKQAQSEDRDSGSNMSSPLAVHLIWAVRDRQEFQLLESELLAAASSSQGWLNLSLWHTSNAEQGKLEGKPCAVQIPGRQRQPATIYANHTSQMFQAAGRESLRHLQSYGFGDAHWAAAHVLAMVGAFFACILVQADKAEGYLTSQMGSPYWSVGLLMALAIVVGSMGLPAIIIFPVSIFRYRKHIRMCEAVQRRIVSRVATTLEMDSAASDTRTCPQLLQDSAMDPENSMRLSVANGRPDLDRLLASIVVFAGDHGRRAVGVIASGSSSLVDASRAACQAVGPLVKQIQRKRGSCQVSFSAHSFEL